MAEGMRSSSIIWAGVVVFVTTIAAMVVLRIKDADTSNLIALASPVISSVVLGGVVWYTSSQQDKKLDEQTHVLHRIEHETNGILEEKIERGSKRAMEKALPDLLRKHDMEYHPETFRKRWWHRG